MVPVNDPALLREEITRLKRLLGEKEEEIIQLREALRPPDWAPPPEIGLTTAEARIIATLYKSKGKIVTKEQLLYVLSHDKQEQPEIKIVDVFVCRLRKKIADYGLVVKTTWGQGYCLDQDSITILKDWGLDPQEQ